MPGAQRSPDAFIIDALRKKGRKATSQRIAICRLLLSSREHPTVQEIYRDVKKAHPTVSLANVYKTLRVLRELRLVQELAFPQGEMRFDSNVSPHVNLVCTKCGNVTDVGSEDIHNIVVRATSTIKFKVTGQRFDVYGVCEKCAKRGAHMAYRTDTDA